MDELLQMFKELTEAPGVPGFEQPVRSVMQRYLEPVSSVATDHLGSIVATKTGAAAAPRIMLAGHMDEIGLMVTRITDEGFLKFQPLGGWFDQVMLAQRMTVLTRQGEITGVIGSKPPHLLSAEQRKKPVEKKDMFIDIGAASADEARAMGVRPGDPVLPICPFTVMKNEKMLLAKAWDDRAGCAIVIEVMRRLAGTEHPNTVFGVGTVQEEVGLRGAQTATHMVEPDIGIALDVGIAGDTPGVTADEAQSKLGKGPCLLLYDATLVAHPRLRDFILDVAASIDIPVQFDAMPQGGTDAGRMHLWGKGVPAVAFGVPVRYIHSHAAVLHKDDLTQAVDLLVAVIERLDQAALDAIRG